MPYVKIYQPYKMDTLEDGTEKGYRAKPLMFASLEAGNAYIDAQKGDWGQVGPWSTFIPKDKYDKPCWILKELMLWDSPPTQQELDDIKKFDIRQKALNKLTNEEKVALGLFSGL